MRTILTEPQILDRVAELAQQIAADYQSRPLTIVGVLTGSLIFLADLTRRLTIPHRIGVLQASSYRGRSTQPGDLRVNVELVPDLQGRHVLLVDDILDTGQTIASLVRQIEELDPLSVRTLVLLRKQNRQSVPIAPDYSGFVIPDVFVVGYGMDFNDDYRHIPYLAELDACDIGDASAAGPASRCKPGLPGAPRSAR